MNFLIRILLFTGGLYIVLVAQAQLKTGNIVFYTSRHHQATFTSSGFGVGFILMLLAFAPPKDWVYKHITTKRPKPKLLQRHRRFR